MIDRKNNEELFEQLYKAFLSLESQEQCQQFLNDLCTYKEVEQMAQRLQAAKLLKQGKTYTQVTDEIDISSATLSRVSRCVKYGEGYLSVLENLMEESKESES